MEIGLCPNLGWDMSKFGTGPEKSAMKKFGFFLMTQKGYEVLQAFTENVGARYIDCVVGARDTNILEDYYEKISKFCKDRQIKFYNRKENYVLNSNYSFAISWRWLLNKPESKLIILHDSLLPKYRGFAPLVNALINGEQKIGVTALFANEYFDRGDIIAQKGIEISYPIKINDAIKTISGCYKDLVIEISQKIICGKEISSYKQDEKLATYSLWLDEKDYAINWERDAEYIKRFIDSVGYPYKGACTILNKRKVRVIDAEVKEDVTIMNRKSSKVLFVEDGCPIVVCEKKLLKLTNVIDDESGKSVLPLKRFRVRFE